VFFRSHKRKLLITRRMILCPCENKPTLIVENTLKAYPAHKWITAGKNTYPWRCTQPTSSELQLVLASGHDEPATKTTMPVRPRRAYEERTTESHAEMPVLPCRTSRQQAERHTLPPAERADVDLHGNIERR